MTRKIKILFITDGLTSGGKERQLVEIIRHLDKTKFEVGVITYNSNQHYSEFVKNNVSYFSEIDKKNKLRPFLSTLRNIRQFRPDLIHTWDLLADIYAFLPLKLFGIPYVNGSVRDAGIEKGWQRKAKIFFLKRAAIVLANSHAGLRAYGVEGVVIYNVLDTGRFRKPYSGSQNNLIMVASFTPYKDYTTFIDAAASLLEKQLIDKVYLVGQGPDKMTSENYVRTTHSSVKEKFLFTGVVHNVEDYLAECRVGVLCSTSRFSEGLSNSVLEYMAAGLVPVVTDIGGSGEIISDGVNGFLVREAAATEIYDRVKELTQHPEVFEKMQLAAQATIAEKFSASANIARLGQLYQNLIAN